MSNIAASVCRGQTAMVLRPTTRSEHDCPYTAILKNQGILLVENPTPESASRAIRMGCRVGVLMLSHADDLTHLEACEPILGLDKVAWIGLIVPELVLIPRVREFIDANLFNFLLLPASPEHVVVTLRYAWSMSFVHASGGRTEREATAEADRLMIGSSEQMQHLFAKIKKVSRSGATVLIHGPSGTGKELAALSIHRQSARKDAPFIAVNCGAITPELLQSELFGYEKGAFTGAQQRRIGKIEAGNGGTLFLDEIGDMPLDMQINLLRFLQERTIVRVGGNEAIPIDVRVIAATHVDLAESVKQGRFREDLYYRINVVCITMPRLAERGRDIADIAQHYFTKFSSMQNQRLCGFSRKAMDTMLQHSWPGNVRELVNRVQRAVVMAEGKYIQPEDLGFTDKVQHNKIVSLEEARTNVDRFMINYALSKAKNQISHAANMLGVSRMTLYRLIEKYNIRVSSIADYSESFSAVSKSNISNLDSARTDTDEAAESAGWAAYSINEIAGHVA
jgi:DNA-binding NtrC family response regulator